MRGQVVTLFGGSGFLGRYITQQLIDKGAIIRIGVRYPDDALFLKPLGPIGQITPIAVDITSHSSVLEASKGADILINCVGILAENNKNQFHDIHVKGVQNIGEAAKYFMTKRVVHISAIGVQENAQSIYARTKAEGEKELLKIFPEATIIRPSIFFGPEDQFFNRFASMAVILPFIPLIGGGKTRFQPIYVNDVAHAVIACLEQEETKGQIFELGGAQIYSFKELIEIMLKHIHRKKHFISLPFGFAKFLSYFLQFFPGKPLTPDQVEMLKSDNIVSGEFPGLETLGITPTSLEIILPVYLSRYQSGGRYLKRSSS